LPRYLYEILIKLNLSQFLMFFVKVNNCFAIINISDETMQFTILVGALPDKSVRLHGADDAMPLAARPVPEANILLAWFVPLTEFRFCRIDGFVRWVNLSEEFDEHFKAKWPLTLPQIESWLRSAVRHRGEQLANLAFGCGLLIKLGLSGDLFVMHVFEFLL
jgi:hypothetical protein